MVYERGEFIINDELRLITEDFFLIGRFIKFFHIFWQKHNDIDITDHIKFFFKLSFFVFKLLCRYSYWQGYGFISPWGRFLVELRLSGRRLSRFCQSGPTHNQRTHSNARTQQMQDPALFKSVISALHAKRRSMKTRANYAKKKLTPMKKKVVKVAQKKKGPVIRTRDKVKSVWA